MERDFEDFIYSSVFVTDLKHGENNHTCFYILRCKTKTKTRGFPGGAVVENLPANAGDTGSSPGLGRFPHAAEQLSP